MKQLCPQAGVGGGKRKRLCVRLPGGYSEPDEVYNHAGTKPQTGLQLGPLGEQVRKTEKMLYSADGTSTGRN